jgi:hypothetical protein
MFHSCRAVQMASERGVRGARSRSPDDGPPRIRDKRLFPPVFGLFFPLSRFSTGSADFHLPTPFRYARLGSKQEDFNSLNLSKIETYSKKRRH